MTTSNQQQPATVLIGAFLNGKLVCTITARNELREIESAKRCLQDSYGPEAKIFRKI